MLKKDVKRYIFPIVDSIPTDFKVRRGQELFGIDFKTREAAVEYLISGPDPWLQAVAMYTVKGRVPAGLRAAVEQNRNDAHPVVRETANLVLRN